jgi:hypothetical protein
MRHHPAADPGGDDMIDGRSDSQPSTRPLESERLFSDAPDWRMNACVNWGGGTLYSDGYKTAADTLVNQVAADRYTSDTLVYPIVFCYRQYLELLLKALLEEARLRFHSDERIPVKHQLLVIWQPLRPLLERCWPGIQAELSATTELLSQFDDVDRLSFAFRYPTNPHGEPSLPQHMVRINLRNLAHIVGRHGSFLERCYEQLSGERDAREYERDDGQAEDHAAYHAA